MADDPRFSMEVAPDAALIGTARLFASSVARHLGCAPEHVDDVKLAVSEACATLMREGGEGPASLRIEVEARPGGIGFELARAVAPGTAPIADLPEPMGLEMIRLLFEDADEVTGDGNRTFRFTAPVQHAAPASGRAPGETRGS